MWGSCGARPCYSAVVGRSGKVVWGRFGRANVDVQPGAPVASQDREPDGARADANARSGASLDGDSAKVALGFVVRECAVELGHAPSPEELADWANRRQDGFGSFCLFGRAITPEEARVILAHPGREVTVRAARYRGDLRGGGDDSPANI